MINIITQLQSHTKQLGPRKSVTREQYAQWTRGFVFEAMRNLSYGQSFCNHFGIHDNILYYATTMADADAYIRKNYVR